MFFYADGKPLDGTVLDKPFSLSVFDYTITIINKTSIQLLPHGINPKGEIISITKAEDEAVTDYFADKHSGELSEPISILVGRTTVAIRVTEDSEEPDMVVYRFVINNNATPIEITDISSDRDAVREGEKIVVNATIEGGLRGNYDYRWTSVPSSLLAGASESQITSPTLSFSIPADFVPRNASRRDALIKVTVADGLSMDSTNKAITVIKANNGHQRFATVVTTSTISIETVASDPDGDGLGVNFDRL